MSYTNSGLVTDPPSNPQNPALFTPPELTSYEIRKRNVHIRDLSFHELVFLAHQHSKVLRDRDDQVPFPPSERPRWVLERLLHSCNIASRRGNTRHWRPTAVIGPRPDSVCREYCFCGRMRLLRLGTPPTQWQRRDKYPRRATKDWQYCARAMALQTIWAHSTKSWPAKVGLELWLRITRWRSYPELANASLRRRRRQHRERTGTASTRREGQRR